MTKLSKWVVNNKFQHTDCSLLSYLPDIIYPISVYVTNLRVVFVLPIWFQGLAEKYKKTAAQIALRWGIQRNTVVIPKTSKLERLKENFQVFDFELSKEDADLISNMDKKYRTNQPAKFWGIDLYAWECPSF